ncbi:MAG: hypothetical protein HY820_21510 [Acidobacteria bacterium]|nr:hypothetical protein [Acidobacteriota bacterium]
MSLESGRLTREQRIQPPSPPVGQRTAITQDVYLIIQGYDHPNQQGQAAGVVEEDMNVARLSEQSPRYLNTHVALKVACYTGGNNPDPSDERSASRWHVKNLLFGGQVAA